jgi:hypothetical protein
MTNVELATVKNFRISNEFGSIEWSGAVDVRNANLDEIVKITHGGAEVYEDCKEEDGTYPPVGMALNRPAIITLKEMFPKKRELSAKAKAKYEEKLKKNNDECGAEFVSYDNNSGEWVFITHHFSRYGLIDDDSDSDDEAADASNANQQPPASVPLPPPSAHLKNAPSALAYSRAALLSTPTAMEDVDVDVTTSDAVMRRANDAYAKLLGSTSASAYDPSEMFGSYGSTNDDVMLLESEHSSVPTPTPPNWAEVNDLRHVRFNANGACARVRESLNIADKASLRDAHTFMGRSHGACFTPDGRLISISPTHVNKLVVTTIAPSPVDTGLLDLLVTEATKTVENGCNCPTYSLPPTPNVLPTLDKYCEHTASEVDTYEEIAEETLVKHRAFTLLSAMFGAEPGAPNTPVDDSRRFQAFHAWLTESVDSDVKKRVRAHLDKKEPHAAIFHALTSGNVAYASAVASEAECFRLAVLLSAGLSVSNAEHIDAQLTNWQQSGAFDLLDGHMLRVYSALGGRSDVENDVFEGGDRDLDWRRRLCLASTLGGGATSIAEAIRRYDEDVSKGVVPQPVPRYLSTQASSDTECLLYRLLKLSSTPMDATRLASVIHPYGYTTELFDCETAFHVASVLVALQRVHPLPLDEAVNLALSYSSTLVNSGRWEHGVVAVLASEGLVAPRDKTACREFSVARAKELVMRFSPSSGSSFLLSAGVPASWFEESQALFAGFRGDLRAHVQHLVRAGLLEQAVSEMNLYIARGLLNDQEPGLFEMLAGMREGGVEDMSGWDSENGPGAVLAFLELKRDLEEVIMLARAVPGSEQSIWSETKVDGLLEAAELLMGKIVVKDPSAYNLTYAEGNAQGLCARRQKSVLAAAFAETRAKLCSMKTLLSILKNDPSSVVSGDSSEAVDSLNGTSLRVVRCLKSGGRVEIEGGLEDMELAAFRSIGSQMIEGM